MNGQAPSMGRSEDSPGGRPSERSDSHGRDAVAELDERIELRNRLAAIVDSLSTGDVVTADINASWLLEDLDALDEREDA